MNTSNGKAVWDAVCELKAALAGKVPPRPQVRMKKEGGGHCVTPQENAEVFSSFFQGLYGREAEVDESALDGIEQQEVMVELDEAPTVADVIEAVKRLNNSTPGESQISAQMLKTLLVSKSTMRMIHDYVIEFWEKEVAPEDWLLGVLKVLPKKGDLGLPKNWRGITLGEVLYKVVSTIIFLRLERVSEKLPHESQVGFRPLRGSRDGIFNAKQAFRKRAEHGCETWAFFLDLVKAFDRVPRDFLWKVLAKLGVPPKLIRLLRALHTDVKVKFTIQEVMMISTA